MKLVLANAYWPFGHYRAKTFGLLKCTMADCPHFEESKRCTLQNIDQLEKRGICPIAPLALCLTLYLVAEILSLKHFGSRDVIAHMTIETTHGPFLLVVC